MNKKKLKIIISGGGTGGHVFPAISIANALKSKVNDLEILFVGALGKMEMEKVPAAGYKIEGLPVAGLHRRLTIKNLGFPFKLLSSMLKAKRIVKSFGPDVVVGVGGYASGPVMKVAANQKIPTLIQEQNSYAGMTNRILSKKAKKICVAYPNMEQYFPAEKITITGNPVRQDIDNLDSKKEEGLAHYKLEKNIKTLLIIGGSLGARTLNNAVIGKLEEIKQAGIQVIWQTGKYYYEKALEASRAIENKHLHTMAFIKEMDLAYASADVIISRAGAGSISELCIVGKPCILVPSPNVAENHQTKNAKALVDREAALLVKDNEAEDTLINTALALLEDNKKQAALADNIKKMARKNAAKDIADEIMKLVIEKNA